MVVRSTKDTTTKRTRHEPEDLTVKFIKTRIAWGRQGPGNGGLWDAAELGPFFLLEEGRVHVAWPSVVGGKCWPEVGSPGPQHFIEI